MDVFFPRSLLGPERYQEQKLRILFEELYADWYTQKVALEPKFIIENIRFDHDPQWREGLFSLTCAREGNHIFWKATKVVWILMGGVW